MNLLKIVHFCDPVMSNVWFRFNQKYIFIFSLTLMMIINRNMSKKSFLNKKYFLAEKIILGQKIFLAEKIIVGQKNIFWPKTSFLRKKSLAEKSDGLKIG